MFQPISETNLTGFQGLADAREKIFKAIKPTLGLYLEKSQSIPTNPRDNQYAIWVVKNPDIDPPQQYTRTGLECLIFPPEGYGTPLYQNAMITEIWRIRLIQHDRSQSTLPGHYALLAQFPDANRVSWLPADRDIHEQLNLSISQTQIVR